MKKNKAIKILKKQIDKLDQYKKGDFLDLWIIQTEYYINEFFHDNSFHVKFFNKLTSPRISQENYDKEFEALRVKLKVLLTSCIETIDDVDVKKPDGRNFLYRLNDAWLTTLLAFAATLFFQAGVSYQKVNDERNYTIEINGDKYHQLIKQPIDNSGDEPNTKCSKNTKSDSCRK